MKFRKILSLDIETRSEVDLPKRGVYNYVNTPSFCLLWVSWAYNYGDVYTLDCWSNPLPEELVRDLLDPTVLKVAANATFERVCFSRILGVYLSPESWTCTLILAGRNGLPMNLAGAAAQARVRQQKDERGVNYIKLFSVPQKPSKKNGWKIWINPEDDPENWYYYGSYNAQDVRTETDVRVATRNIPVGDFEDYLYALDQRINDRGVLVDRVFVQQAIRINGIFAERIKQEVIDLTGVRNPNSVKQLLEWLNAETEEEFEKLNKDVLKAILADPPSDLIREVMERRELLSRASVAKYRAMDNFAGSDNRVRGTLQFYGANRTGRWAGRGVQVQNMTKHKVKPAKLNEFRDLIRRGDLEGLAAANDGDLTGALSQAVRTAFVAKPGHHFIVSDYSAIEARVLAWLAGEQWRLDHFRKGEGDIYIESVARMLKLDPTTIDRKNPLRQIGKLAELACGYMGGVGAWKKFGALEKGLKESELSGKVEAWRNENPAIVAFWHNLDRAALKAITYPNTIVQVDSSGKVQFTFRGENLHMILPSGRWLTYVRAHIVMNHFGKAAVRYEGVGDQGKWMRLDAYGGKWAENCCQAVSRDILAVGLFNLDMYNFDIVMHVHDEAVIEEPDGGRSLEEVNYLMCQKAPWYEDLPLEAAGFVSPYYKKDDD